MTICTAETLYELDGDLLGYYARGHWTGEELLAAVKWANGDEVTFNPANVRQTYYRQVPLKGDVCDFQLIESKPGRGAFPVTVWEDK